MVLSLEGIRAEVEKTIGTLTDWQNTTDRLAREMAAENLELLLQDLDDIAKSGKVELTNAALAAAQAAGGQQPAKVPPTGPAARQNQPQHAGAR